MKNFIHSGLISKLVKIEGWDSQHSRHFEGADNSRNPTTPPQPVSTASTKTTNHVRVMRPYFGAVDEEIGDFVLLLLQVILVQPSLVANVFWFIGISRSVNAKTMKTSLGAVENLEVGKKKFEFTLIQDNHKR